MVLIFDIVKIVIMTKHNQLYCMTILTYQKGLTG